MAKINYTLLPVKAHYFFFMASLGPILHQLNVFGKQLGVSEVVIGSINAILPILFLLAKPLFGFIVDYFRDKRKIVFIGLIFAMNSFYILMYFVPQPEVPIMSEYKWADMNCSEIKHCSNLEPIMCSRTRNVKCNWHCSTSHNGTDLPVLLLPEKEQISTVHLEICTTVHNNSFECPSSTSKCDFTCFPDKSAPDCLYGTTKFWIFVLLMSLGTIAFNVANSVSDAICFDVLGSGDEMKYGKQRMWGTIGFGVTALLSGFAVDWFSIGYEQKNYTPAFVLIFIFGIIDLYCCTKLQLPSIQRADNIFKDLGKLLKHKHIVIFLLFATLAGVVDSFIIYFLFWYLEDLSGITGSTSNMKLLEGMTIAAETLVGEVLFFSLSGKILKKIGYGHSLTLCFLSYALRLGLLSFITSPWWVLPIELFMQGPTYALCYTTIVAYASAVSPPGTSATMQGIVAGMDDGFGYAVGSMIGGLLYQKVGGSKAFKLFATTAAVCSLLHFIIYQCFLKKHMPPVVKTHEGYKSPVEASQITDTPDSIQKSST